MQVLQRKHILQADARSQWYRFKLTFGLGVKTEKNFLVSEAALRFMRGLLPQGAKITTFGRRDGIGMQALSRMSAIAFAKAFGAEYIHTPFESIDHTPAHQVSWAQKWEDFFGFSKHYKVIDETYEIIDYQDYMRRPKQLASNSVLFFQQCWWFTRRYPDFFLNIAPELRAGMNLSTERGEKLRAAIHVRRGDVSASANKMRYTDDESILRSIDSLRRMAKETGRDLAISVYSQGSPEDFSAFKARGCELHLDTDAIETMKAMIESDILVMSKSSFSYVAALLNTGVIVYEPTFNPPLSSWIRKRGDGSVDVRRLVAALDKARPV